VLSLLPPESSVVSSERAFVPDYRAIVAQRRIPMQAPRIVLSLAGEGPVPRTWSSTCHLRIGRLPELEIALDDMSVSPIHAEIPLSDDGWVVRDRGNSNGTVLNGVRIGRTPQPVREGDSIQVGTLVFKVDHLQVRPATVRLGHQTVQVEASARRSWSEAV